MSLNKSFIVWFKEIGLGDLPRVGGKNAALGEMYSHLVPLGINVPNGFATSAEAYRYFLNSAGLQDKIREILARLKTDNIADLQKRGRAVRALILKADLPEDFSQAIREAYRKLEQLYGRNADVAVRSSATAEDLPGASFAGQQETYLNVRGEEEVLAAVQKCIASLFTNRAISYRVDKGFSHLEVALSVGVQKMVRSDLAASGAAFTIHTETGFDKLIMINSSYGLGEMVVGGSIIPDEYLVFKPSLEEGFKAIISKKLGEKTEKIIYNTRGTKKVKVSRGDQERFSLADEEVLATRPRLFPNLPSF